MNRGFSIVFYSLLLALAAGTWTNLAAFSDGAALRAAETITDLVFGDDGRYGELTGRVSDVTGNPVSSVSILVVEINRGTVSEEDGRYSLPRIPAGTYRVSFTRTGYAPEVRRVEIGRETPALDVSIRESIIELPGIQVTASANPTTSLNSPQPIGILDESDLHTHREASLGETVKDMPGVRSWSTGSGIGKPVIRGLGSDRVLVALDGQRIETQQWGDEHSPNVDIDDLDHIEVIRGPASVLYGSDALGGVVNLIPKPLPNAIGIDPFIQGRTSLYYGENNAAFNGGVTVEGAREGFGFRGSWYGRDSDDIHTPEGALFNSGYKSSAGQGALGYKSTWGSVEAHFSHHDERIEIHEDPVEEPGFTGFQKIQEDFARLSSSLPLGGRSRLELSLNMERNRRREFEEAGAVGVGLGLLSKTVSGLAHFHHPQVGPFEGLLGFNALHNSFDKFGEETLIPNSTGNNIGLFVFEEAEKGPWHFSFGARYDHINLDVEDDADLGVTAQTRRWNSFSGNVGLLYSFTEPMALVLNVGRGFRAPSNFNLYSNGIHEGTVAFERGNPNLGSEHSLNTDLALRIQTSRVRAEISAFVNRISDYIYSRPTGLHDTESGYEIYDFVQGNATLTGFEISGEVHPHRQIHLSAGADWVWGKNTTSGNPLPWIPPLRLDGSIRYETGSFVAFREPYLEFGMEYNSRQKRLDPAENSYPGYALGRFGAGCTLGGGSHEIDLALTVRNLFDKRYTNFLSRYRSYALDQGRAAVLRVGMKF